MPSPFPDIAERKFIGLSYLVFNGLKVPAARSELSLHDPATNNHGWFFYAQQF